MALLIVFLLFSNMSQNSEINKLQKQQETLAESANQSLAYMQQQINSLSSQLYNLEQSLKSVDEDTSKDNQETNENENSATDNKQTNQTDGESETNSTDNSTDDTSGDVSENNDTKEGVNSGE